MLKTGFSNIQGKIAAPENPIIYEKHITYDWNYIHHKRNHTSTKEKVMLKKEVITQRTQGT